MMFSRRRLGTALVAANSFLAIGASAAGASAATTPIGPAPPESAPIDKTFVPPKVGPITVEIGPTIIDGKVMDPGRQVTVPGVTVE